MAPLRYSAAVRVILLCLLLILPAADAAAQQIRGAVIDVLVKQALEAGNTSPYFHGLTRPWQAEEEATHRAIMLANLTGAPLYVVHVSAKQAVEQLAAARDNGQNVFGETCPQYLYLSLEEQLGAPGFEGAKWVCSTPLRSRAEGHQHHMWQSLRTNDIQMVSTDHCPFCMKGQKDMGLTDFSKINQDPDTLSELTRQSLSRQICSNLANDQNIIPVITLDRGVNDAHALEQFAHVIRATARGRLIGHRADPLLLGGGGRGGDREHRAAVLCDGPRRASTQRDGRLHRDHGVRLGRYDVDVGPRGLQRSPAHHHVLLSYRVGRQEQRSIAGLAAEPRVVQRRELRRDHRTAALDEVDVGRRPRGGDHRARREVEHGAAQRRYGLLRDAGVEAPGARHIDRHRLVPRIRHHDRVRQCLKPARLIMAHRDVVTAYVGLLVDEAGTPRRTLAVDACLAFVACRVAARPKFSSSATATK